MKKKILLETSFFVLLLLWPSWLRSQIMTAADASSHVGETVTVCGKVTGVHVAASSRGKPTFVDFDKPYPSETFTVVIWDEDRPAFGNLAKYTGEQVCAHGIIKEYKGKPEMVLRSPEGLQAK